jgi:hypothetical protein
MVFCGYSFPMKQPSPALFGPDLPLHAARAVEAAASAIARLDARFSVSSVRAPWQRRASWRGYARALQLQGAEIDATDVFCWACDVTHPARPLRVSTLNEFSALGPWQAAIGENGNRHWREDLPFDPAGIAPSTAPALLRALDVVAHYARVDETIQPWLALPLLLQRMDFTTHALPILVEGDKRLRFSGQYGEGMATRILVALEKAAKDGLEMLEELEEERARSIRVNAGLRRPGALFHLSASFPDHPILSPASTAERLGLSLSGAGKLLDRAASLGLLREVSGRKTWKLYMTPETAVSLGFATRDRGRPRRKQPPPLPQGPLGDVMAAFDREMAAIEAKYPLTISGDGEYGE